MKKENTVLARSPLFLGICQEEQTEMLGCLGARQLKYLKGSFIAREGESLNEIGIVLEGSVCIIKEDFWGNCNILAKVEAGQLFGETYACLPSQPLEISVTAESEVQILFLDVGKVLHTCSHACSFHTRLVQNLMQVLAGKNQMLTRKIQHLGQRTTREKVLSYLSEQAKDQKGKEFEIPFTRQQLADYLSVDRSALSSVLGTLQKEGVLTFRKNSFVLEGENR